MKKKTDHFLCFFYKLLDSFQKDCFAYLDECSMFCIPSLSGFVGMALASGAQDLAFEPRKAHHFIYPAIPLNLSFFNTYCRLQTIKLIQLSA